MSLSGLILCLKISRPIVQLLLRPNVQRNVHGEDRKQSMLLQVVSGLENMQCCRAYRPKLIYRILQSSILTFGAAFAQFSSQYSKPYGT